MVRINIKIFNTLTVFHSNSHLVILEILLFASSGSKQTSKISNRRPWQATEPISWVVTEYLNYSGKKIIRGKELIGTELLF